ncbi:hypothetical protein KJ865_09000, partial [Myxococcota bacterium]|nr:hypothetical protein [Myxococcota bacterium]
MRRLLLSENSEFGKKFRYAQIFIIACFLILAGRLVQLQVVYGSEYRALSNHNFLQKRRIDAPRGLIYDKQGTVLAKNIVAFNVYITPLFFKERSFQFLIRLLDLPQSDIDFIKHRIMMADGRKRTYSLLAIRDIPKEWAMILESNKNYLRGLDIVPQEKRFYPQGALASHLMGFVSEVNREDLDNFKEYKYLALDWRGKTGLEWKYEKQMRGERGYVWRILDARGRRVHDPKSRRWMPKPWRKDPVPGLNLHLTIDAHIQRAVEQAMSVYNSGAAVVMEVKTGKILAYTSKPSFDPNELSGKLSTTRAHEIY